MTDVMISIHCGTMTDSALALQAFLQEHGVSAWVCVQMSGGTNYRESIVDAVKNCKVFLPLINNEWALSGECEDEYSLAKRLNLTSHERGQTQRTELRQPILLPIAFPNLNWSAHKHVELLAAKTNFIVHDAHNLLEGSRSRTLTTLLVSMAAAGIEIQNPPVQVVTRIEAFKISGAGNNAEPVSDKERLATIHSTLESLASSVQDVLISITHKSPNVENKSEGESNEASGLLGKEYLGVVTAQNVAGDQTYWYADSTHIVFDFDPSAPGDQVPLSGTIVQKELRKLVNQQENVPDSNPLAGWVRERKTMNGVIRGTWSRQSGFVNLILDFDTTMGKKAWFNVLDGQISGMLQVLDPHMDKEDPYCTAGLTLKQVR